MDTLWHRYHEKIKGVIEGFDRIVFKGTLRPLIYAAGMQSFKAATESSIRIIRTGSARNSQLS